MAGLNKKVTSLIDLGATPASGDWLYVIDVSDTTDGTEGTGKKVSYSRIPSGSAGQPSTVTTFYPSCATNYTGGGAAAFSTPGQRVWGEIMIPFNVTLTGIGYKTGTNGTDKFIAELHDNSGVFLVRSSGAGTLTSGSSGSFQKLPFTAPYAAPAGRYFIALQSNGTTDQYFYDPVENQGYVCGTAAGTFGVSANFTPGTSYTINLAPVSYVY